MREILFRGKRLDNGEWVEGNLFILKQYQSDIDHYYILPTNTVCLFCDIFYYAVEVDPSTVGQHTGLCDNKNGKKIFEGDIVLRFGCCYKVCFENGQWVAVDNYGFWIDLYAGVTYTVIGNKWDNPELLEDEG